MAERVSKSLFIAKARELFRQVETGAPVTTTDRGDPRLEVGLYRSEARDPLAALRGSVLRYDGPTEPIAEEDWEVAK